MDTSGVHFEVEYHMLSWSLNEDKSIPLPLSLQAMDHRLKSTRISTSVA